MMHYNCSNFLHNALDHQPTPKEVLRFLVDLQVSKFLSKSIFSIGRPHNDTRINASKCFKFRSTSAITLHPKVFGKSMFTYSGACQAKVALSVESKLHNRNCRSYWNLEVFARVPRLEANYVSIYKLQPL